jgi:hypothetical protein
MAGAFTIDLFVDNGNGNVKSSEPITVYAVDGETHKLLAKAENDKGTVKFALRKAGTGTAYFQFSIGSTPILATAKFVTTLQAPSRLGLVMKGVKT